MVYVLSFLLTMSLAWSLGDPNFIPANPPGPSTIQQKQEAKNEKKDQKKKSDGKEKQRRTYE